MKLIFGLTVTAFILVLTACSVEPEISCPDVEFTLIHGSFDPLLSFNGLHQMVDNDGIVLNLNKEFDQTFEDQVDENGCSLGFDESFVIKYFNNNSKVAEVKLVNLGSIHLLSVTVSSMVAENNTNNLFEVDMFDGKVKNCNSIEEINCFENYQLNGILHPYLFKIERAPQLPNNELMEIVKLHFSLSHGIVYIELENGRYLNFRQ